MPHIAELNINALILDMDGVLWRAYQPIGDLAKIFKRIEQKGLKFTLATNNSTRTVGKYQEILRSFGVDVQPEQVITSAVAAAAYLSSEFPNGGSIYVIGEEGLVDTLAEAGFENNESDVDCVVVGLDKSVTYEKLRKATLLIRSGVPFIGSNPDKTFPTPEGQVPGAGAILAALEASTDMAPLIIGKPKPGMFVQAMNNMNSTPEETLVVGDRLETDIAGGQNAGCSTAVVLSGVTDESQAHSWKPDPDIIISDLSTLMDLLP